MTVFSNVMPNLNSALIQNGIVAFFGAFFAFMFVMIAKRVSLQRKGNVNHHNSLVRIERYLNKIITRLEQSKVFLSNNLDALKEKMIVSWTSPEIPFNDGLIEDLRNIDFINDFRSFLTDMEVFKMDFLSQEKRYEEIKNCYFMKVFPLRWYEKNIESFVTEYEKMLPYIEHSRKKAIRLVSITRLLTGEKRAKTHFFFKFPRKHYKKSFEKEVQQEIDRFKKELDKSRAESQKEIDSIAQKSTHNEEDSEKEENEEMGL